MSRETIKKQLSTLAIKHQVPCISSATEEYLLQHLMKNKPNYILEIGSAIGYSTGCIANTIRPRNGHITSFEISQPSYMTALFHLRQTSLTNQTIYHIDFLQAPLDKLLVHPLDFIFIDGGKAEYADYVERILPYCSEDFTCICDDVVMYADKVHPLYEVINKHNLQATSLPLDVDDGILLITR